MQDETPPDDGMIYALDGLIAATNYADRIGESELAREIGTLHVSLARAAPAEHRATGAHTYTAESAEPGDD